MALVKRFICGVDYPDIDVVTGHDHQVYGLNFFLSCTQSKSAHVIGFNWTNLNEIVFITNQGLEFYQV